MDNCTRIFSSTKKVVQVNKVRGVKEKVVKS